jgi:hypothetical protein
MAKVVKNGTVKEIPDSWLKTYLNAGWEAYVEKKAKK